MTTLTVQVENKGYDINLERFVTDFNFLIKQYQVDNPTDEKPLCGIAEFSFYLNKLLTTTNDKEMQHESNNH